MVKRPPSQRWVCETCVHFDCVATGVGDCSVVGHEVQATEWCIQHEPRPFTLDWSLEEANREMVYRLTGKRPNCFIHTLPDD